MLSRYVMVKLCSSVLGAAECTLKTQATSIPYHFFIQLSQIGALKCKKDVFLFPNKLAT